MFISLVYVLLRQDSLWFNFQYFQLYLVPFCSLFCSSLISLTCHETKKDNNNLVSSFCYFLFYFGSRCSLFPLSCYVFFNCVLHLFSFPSLPVCTVSVVPLSHRLHCYVSLLYVPRELHSQLSLVFIFPGSVR